MTIRDLLSSTGSAADIGDLRQSAAGDAFMMSKGFLPARGGILTQAAYPALYAGIKHRGYSASFSDNPLISFQNGNMVGPLSDFDGDDLIMYTSTSSSYYWQLVRASTGASVGGGYLTSYLPKLVRFSGTACYITDQEGNLFRFAGPAYTSYVQATKAHLGLVTYKDIFDVLEHNGYIYLATGEGILRALLTANLSQAASWTKVFNYSYAYVYNTPGTTQQCNFFVDPVSGHLFFQTATGIISRSTNGGGTWANINTPTSGERSKIVRWGVSLYMFMRNTPKLASITSVDQYRVLKSTDDGASWAYSTMQLHSSANYMQPFVKNGFLFYAYNEVGNDVKIRMLLEERSGLQVPTTPEWHSNVLEVAAFSMDQSKGLQAAFKSNDAFGARLITHSLTSAANTYPASRLIVPNFDLATQFRLPVIDSQIPTYLKAA